MDHSSTITITRPWAWTGAVRKFRILCDAVEVARIANKSSTTFQVAPGPHDFLVKMDWLGGKPLRVVVAPGEHLQLVCASADDFAQSLLATFGQPNTYLQLRPYSDADQQRPGFPWGRVAVHCAIWFAVVLVFSIGAMIVITNAGSPEPLEEAQAAVTGVLAGISLVIGWFVVAARALIKQNSSK